MSNPIKDQTESKVVFANTESLIGQTLDKKFHKPTELLSPNAITSGFQAIDQITKGYHKGELITIAVRPGIGKTSFLISMLNNIAVCQGHTVGVFSTEREAIKLMKRMIESTTGIAIDKINGGHLTDIETNHVKSVINGILNANILIDDQAGISTQTISEKSLLMKNQGCELIMIDYMELLHSNNTASECEEDDMCNVVLDLHKLAKEIDLPVVLFSQLMKPVIFKNKYKYTPDYVNNNTDTLIFLNRPSYYHINQIDHIADDVAEVTIAKNINIGEMQMTTLRIIESLGQFKDQN
jgi:replicative DNA helicase